MSSTALDNFTKFIETVEEDRGSSPLDLAERMVTFGKHRNSTYAEVWRTDKGYCAWMIKQDSNKYNEKLQDYIRACIERDFKAPVSKTDVSLSEQT